MSTPATRLRLLREQSGLSQDQFAKALGVSQIATISRWENGRNLPKLRQKQAIAKATASTVEDVSSWLETGKPELSWQPDRGQQFPATTANAEPAQDPTGTDEGERAIAFWFWRYELTEAQRGEAIRKFRLAITRTAPTKPKAWGSTTGRSGGEAHR